MELSWNINTRITNVELDLNVTKLNMTAEMSLETAPVVFTYMGLRKVELRSFTRSMQSFTTQSCTTQSFTTQSCGYYSIYLW